MTVNEYITQNWTKTLREAGGDPQNGIPLPKPFNVPSLDNRFNSLFYWDTYFLNLGLIADGLVEQAKNNLENMAYLIDVLGYMPNSNKITYHSQPPLLTRGVYDIYLATHDKSVAVPFLSALKKEHDFYMTKRSTSIGLNHYYCSLPDEELKRHYPYFSRRMSMEFEDEAERNDFTRRLFGICESGWDTTPRFDREGRVCATDEFVPIDLNCILYDMELKIAEFSSWAGDSESEKKFLEFADKRKALIQKYLLNEKTNLYYDYNFKTKKFSRLLSAASFFPYALGISTDVTGLKKTLEKLEFAHGISACEKHDDYVFQWDYPLMWPSNVWAAFVALSNFGLTDDAKRVAAKYIATVDETFAKTGTLWEKYDAEKGYLGRCVQEGDASPMLGWSAGVYKFLITH